MGRHPARLDKTADNFRRLIMNVKSMKEGGVPVGDTEVLAYMYPRTMESPLTEQWQRIYYLRL